MSHSITQHAEMQRLIEEYSRLKCLEEGVSALESERENLDRDSEENAKIQESPLSDEIFRVPKEVSGSKNTLVGEKVMEESNMKNFSGKIRWVDDVRASLVALGGSASLHAIYRDVEARRRKGNRSLPRTLEATVRRTLEDHSSDSANFRSADLFKNIGRGEWALRNIKKKNGEAGQGDA